MRNNEPKQGSTSEDQSSALERLANDFDEQMGELPLVEPVSSAVAEALDSAAANLVRLAELLFPR